MAMWKRKRQKREGNYFFSGTFYATKAVHSNLKVDEILTIYKDVRIFVRQKNGISHFQVYTDENGRTLYFIDQLNRKMIRSGKYKPEDNYCTLLFAEEY